MIINHPFPLVLGYPTFSPIHYTFGPINLQTRILMRCGRKPMRPQIACVTSYRQHLRTGQSIIRFLLCCNSGMRWTLDHKGCLVELSLEMQHGHALHWDKICCMNFTDSPFCKEMALTISCGKWVTGSIQCRKSFIFHWIPSKSKNT